MKTSISLFAVFGRIVFSFQAASAPPSIINPKASQRLTSGDLNNLGIPTARYKRRRAGLRDPADDHPCCPISYISITRDNGGAGYVRFSGDKPAGCL